MVGLFGKDKEQPVDPEARPVIEAAMRVHDALGCGLDRSAYVEALAVELAHAQIPHESHLEFPVTYRDRTLSSALCADFRVHDGILVLVRAMSDLGPRDVGALVSLVKAAGGTEGMLLNFGTTQLEVRRAVARQSS